MRDPQKARRDYQLAAVDQRHSWRQRAKIDEEGDDKNESRRT